MAPWSDKEQCRKDHSFCTQLADFYSENERLRARVAELEGEVERLKTRLTDFREHGVRADLCPTTRFGGGEADMYEQWVAYLGRIDASVRQRARAALEGDSNA